MPAPNINPNGIPRRPAPVNRPPAAPKRPTSMPKIQRPSEQSSPAGNDPQAPQGVEGMGDGADDPASSPPTDWPDRQDEIDTQDEEETDDGPDYDFYENPSFGEGDENQVVTRRPFLVAADEGLLIAGSPLDLVDRFSEWLTYANMDPESVIVSPFISIPLPDYPPQWDDGRKRWSGINPSMMWHPLMWLSDRLAFRYTIIDPVSKEERLETTDEWAVRIALECEASGVFDVTTGGWVDVIAGLDMDITAPDVLDRLQRWMDGAADPIFDGFDIDPLIENLEDPDWAVNMVVPWMDELRVVVYAEHAVVLHDYIEEFERLVSTHETDADHLKLALIHVGNIAKQSFEGAPERARQSSTALADDNYWNGVVNLGASDNADIQYITDVVIADIKQRLNDIVNFYDPVLDELIDAPDREPIHG